MHSRLLLPFALTLLVIPLAHRMVVGLGTDGSATTDTKMRSDGSTTCGSGTGTGASGASCSAASVGLAANFDPISVDNAGTGFRLKFGFSGGDAFQKEYTATGTAFNVANGEDTLSLRPLGQTLRRSHALFSSSRSHNQASPSTINMVLCQVALVRH